MLAGLAWLAATLLTAYLAFLQFQYSAGASGRLANDVLSLAVGNGVSAVITLFFAAKLLIGATRRFLFWSATWGVLNVLWAVYQISQGVTADVYIMATVAAGAAGLLSLVAAVQTPTAVAD